MPNSRIMIHQPLGGASGQAVDIEIQAKEIMYHKVGERCLLCQIGLGAGCRCTASMLCAYMLQSKNSGAQAKHGQEWRHSSSRVLLLCRVFAGQPEPHHG